MADFRHYYRITETDQRTTFKELSFDDFLKRKGYTIVDKSVKLHLSEYRRISKPAVSMLFWAWQWETRPGMINFAPVQDPPENRQFISKEVAEQSVRGLALILYVAADVISGK